MASSKFLLAEQVKFRLGAGWPDVNAAVSTEDVIKAIEQKANALLKLEHLSVTLPSGETVPDNLSLAFYEGIEVTSLSQRSKCTLPVMPISLPRGMGVFSIEDPKGLTSFIPLLASQRILLKSQPLISDLMGQLSFEVRGKEVYFSKDITLMGIDTVNMLLVVLDMEAYSDTDPLPISADKEDQIINELVKQFSGVQELADAKLVFGK